MNKKCWGLLLICLIATSAIAKAESALDQQNVVNQFFLDKLSPENNLKFERLTSEGSLQGCSLNYLYSFRDFHSNQGAVVVVSGNFSNMYFKGKSVAYSFKIIPKLVNTQTGDLITLQPQYVDLFIDNKSLAKYKTTEFKCELGGKCIGFADNDISLSESVMRTRLQNFEVKFSTSKKGLDSAFKLSNVISKENFDREVLGFLGCVNESLDLTMQDLESIPKGKSKK